MIASTGERPTRGGHYRILIVLVMSAAVALPPGSPSEPYEVSVTSPPLTAY